MAKSAATKPTFLLWKAARHQVRLKTRPVKEWMVILVESTTISHYVYNHYGDDPVSLIRGLPSFAVV